MSSEPSSESNLRYLLETALTEYKRHAGTDILDHRLIIELQNCDSADAINAILQEQAQSFRGFRGDDGKLIRWLKRTVHVLYTLSTSSALGSAAGLVRWKLPASRTGPFSDIFETAISTCKCDLRGNRDPSRCKRYLIGFLDLSLTGAHYVQAIKDVSASYDALVDLFESTENFLRRLDIYVKIPQTRAMTEIIVKIMVELLSILAIATQQVKQGRLSASISL